MVKTAYQLDNILWENILQNLGEVTDLKITPIIDSEYLKLKITYNSNGVEKSDYISDYSFLITSLHYIAELISPVKKYTHAP